MWTFTIYAVQELNLPNALLFYKQIQSIQFNLVLSNWIRYLCLYLIANALNTSTEYLLMSSSIRKLKILCTVSHILRQNQQEVTSVRSLLRPETTNWCAFWMQESTMRLVLRRLIIMLLFGTFLQFKGLVWRFMSTLTPTLPAQVELHMQASCFQVNHNFPPTENAILCKTLKHYSGIIPHLCYYLLVIFFGNDLI